MQYEAIGWRAAFMLPLIVAVPATLGLVWLVRSPGTGRAVADWGGTASSAVGIGGLVVSLQIGSGRLGFTHPVAVAGYVFAAFGFVAFAFAEHRAVQTVLPLKLLGQWTILLALLSK